jgi:hypothetical protein
MVWINKDGFQNIPLANTHTHYVILIYFLIHSSQDYQYIVFIYLLKFDFIIHISYCLKNKYFVKKYKKFKINDLMGF